jgi:predicted RNA-binding protein with TRAM domain
VSRLWQAIVSVKPIGINQDDAILEIGYGRGDGLERIYKTIEHGSGAVFTATFRDCQGAGDASIQGFATTMSVNRGETVRFKIKTVATAYRIDVYRMGYYQGNGARIVDTLNRIAEAVTIRVGLIPVGLAPAVVERIGDAVLVRIPERRRRVCPGQPDGVHGHAGSARHRRHDLEQDAGLDAADDEGLRVVLGD